MYSDNLQIIVTELVLKNVRIFKEKHIKFEVPITIIIGKNGTGKTSIVEALHVIGNARSFKTSHLKEMIKQGSEALFIKAVLKNNQQITIGINTCEKIIKVDHRSMRSIQELQSIIKIITIAENDLKIVQDSPSHRRNWIDEMIVMLKPNTIDLFKKAKTILNQKNQLFNEKTEFEKNSMLREILDTQFIEVVKKIQFERKLILSEIKIYSNIFLKEYFEKDIKVDIAYLPRIDLLQDEAIYTKKIKELRLQEDKYKRSLFGHHLDDFAMRMNNIDARAFCSRGEQKVLLLFLKLSIIKMLNENQYIPICILDDFITDLDKENIQKVLKILCFKIKTQMIITSPTSEITHHVTKICKLTQVKEENI